MIGRLELPLRSRSSLDSRDVILMSTGLLMNSILLARSITDVLRTHFQYLLMECQIPDSIYSAIPGIPEDLLTSFSCMPT